LRTGLPSQGLKPSRCIRSARLKPCPDAKPVSQGTRLWKFSFAEAERHEPSGRAQEPEPAEERRGRMSTSRGRILIVDDEEEIVRPLGRVVGREGLTPLLAKSGAEALQTGPRRGSRVLLVDFRMPGMDGMELMRQSQGDRSGAAGDPDLRLCGGARRGGGHTRRGSRLPRQAFRPS